MRLITASPSVAWFLLFALVWVSESNAQSNSIDLSPNASIDQQAEIVALVEMLDSNRFAERQAASRALSSVGLPAIASLEHAAAEGRVEPTRRAIDLLRGLAASPERETSDQAVASLLRLSVAPKQSTRGLANAAIEILKRRIGPDRIDALHDSVVQQRLEVSDLSVRVTNGRDHREIEVFQDGEHVVVRSAEDGAVSITWDLPNGDRKTFRAKSLDELKRQSMPAFRKAIEITQLADDGPHRMDATRVTFRQPTEKSNPKAAPFTKEKSESTTPSVEYNTLDTETLLREIQD